MERVLDSFLAQPVGCLRGRSLCICSGIFPLSPCPALRGLSFPLFCSQVVIPWVGSELISILTEMISKRCCRVFTRNRWAEHCFGTPQNETANLLPLCFADSLRGPQPEVTCIGKGCLHSRRLNCFGCLQISILH